jgi:predicted nicotinamide N-methyase
MSRADGSDGGQETSSATVYEGPVSTTTVMVAGRTLRLMRPAEPDRLLDAPDVAAWNQRDDYMPYWAYLWPGAFLLAKVVADAEWVAGTPALEIGCGLGLAGLAGLVRGLRVTFSDYDATPLDFVTRSALASGFDAASFATRRLDWRDLSGAQFPVILGADVLYERRLVPLVAGALAAMLKPGGLALIADPYRVSAEGFPAAVGALGLECDVVPVSADSAELGPVRGTLHRVTRPTLPA